MKLNLTGRSRSSVRSQRSVLKNVSSINSSERDTRNSLTGRKRIYKAEEHRVPVLVRGVYQGIPAQTRRPTKNRKRVDVSLNTPGAELRLPAFLNIKIGWRLISGLLSLFIGVILYVAWTAPIFRVQSITVEGLNRLTVDEVLLPLGIQGEPVFLLDETALNDKILNSFPEFSTVEVKIGFPNSISITVAERIPLLVWRQEERTLLVDANGFAFPVRDESENLPALVVEARGSPPGLQTPELENSQVPLLPVEMISGIMSLTGIVPSGTPIVFDENYGVGWKDKRGWDVFFGSMKDIQLKMKIYEVLVKKIKHAKQEPVLISVQYTNAPYYRLER